MTLRGSFPILIAILLTANAAQAQSVETGQTIFRQRCMSCHGLGAMAAFSSGPALAGVFNRPVASAPGFEYSEALKKAGGVWSAARLDTWLTNPAAFAPGAAMTQMLPDAQERADVIAYLKALQ